MLFWKLNILSLVLVIVVGRVRGQDDYDGPIDASGVDDNDDELADEDYGYNGNGQFYDGGNEGAKKLNGDNDDEDIIEADDVQYPDKNSLGKFAGKCPEGKHITLDCNICYCYKDNAQGCTNVDCSKLLKKKLLGNPKQRQIFKKLRDHATGCVPGEKIQHGDCECNCAIPSVLTCPKECLG